MIIYCGYRFFVGAPENIFGGGIGRLDRRCQFKAFSGEKRFLGLIQLDTFHGNWLWSCFSGIGSSLGFFTGFIYRRVNTGIHVLPLRYIGIVFFSRSERNVVIGDLSGERISVVFLNLIGHGPVIIAYELQIVIISAEGNEFLIVFHRHDNIVIGSVDNVIDDRTAKVMAAVIYIHIYRALNGSVCFSPVLGSGSLGWLCKHGVHKV